MTNPNGTSVGRNTLEVDESTKLQVEIKLCRRTFSEGLGIFRLLWTDDSYLPRLQASTLASIVTLPYLERCAAQQHESTCRIEASCHWNKRRVELFVVSTRGAARRGSRLGRLAASVVYV